MSSNGRREEGCNERSQTGIVAIAGSAGGVEAMRRILACLPTDFPAPILYYHHLNGSSSSALAEMLQCYTALDVRWAQQGDQLMAGVVYVCPVGCYPFVHPGGTVTMRRAATRLDMLRGADSLFASVAASYANRAVAVVLSGGCWDGMEGVCAVRAHHGTVLVQDEASAFQWSMPRSAIATGCVDLVLPLNDIAPALVSLARAGYSLAPLRSSVARLVERSRMSKSPAFQDRWHEILSTELRIHGADLGNIQLLDPDAGNLAIIAQRGFGLDFLEHFEAVTWDDESACARAMRAREPVVIRDVTTDPLFTNHRSIAAAAGFRSVQSTPLLNRDGSLLGILSMHFRRPFQQSRPEPYLMHPRTRTLIQQFAV
jgi:hypothetical protein